MFHFKNNLEIKYYNIIINYFIIRFIFHLCRYLLRFRGHCLFHQVYRFFYRFNIIHHEVGKCKIYLIVRFFRL